MATLLGMEEPDIAALMPGEPAWRARQVYEAIYNKRVETIDRINGLPRALRASLSAEHSLGRLSRASRYEAADGTRRYLLSLSDGKTVEAVWMPEPGRDTLCLSTQVGCPVDCKFCLTALMGLERNLTAGEIVGQVIHLADDNNLWADQKRVNLVFMGQGEPLLNLPNVLRAVRILGHSRGFGISVRRMTISTSGIIPRMAELAQVPDSERPRLAISLNASNEEQRRELMPITRKHHLSDLIDACRGYPLRSWEKLSFEYVLLSGVNDSEADARRVARLLARINCKVNLIALNPGPGIPFQTPPPERVARFQEILRRSFPTFIRRPRGLDIYAACGQLKRMESLTQIV